MSSAGKFTQSAKREDTNKEGWTQSGQCVSCLQDVKSV